MADSLNFAERGSGTPLVILHGLLGSGRNWATYAAQAAATHRVLTVDLRNHGRSPWDHEMTYPAMARDVVALLDDRGIGAARLMGHSMGGKVAMTLALTQPERVERLVVVDIAPVTYGAAFAAPYVAALAAIDPTGHTSRRSVDEALAETVPDDFLRGFLMTNLVRAQGGLGWCVNLAAITRHMDDLMGFPAHVGAYDGPALFVGGARSDFLAAHREPAVRRFFPSGTITRIPEAGHWVHVEAPKAFAEAVAKFL